MSEKKKKCPKSYPSERATLIFWCGLVFHVFFRKKTKSCLFASCVGRGFCCCYYKSKAMKGHRRKRRKRKWEEGMRRTIALRLTRWAPVVTFGWIPFESLLFPPYNFHTTDKLFVTVCVVVLCIKQYVFGGFFYPPRTNFCPLGGELALVENGRKMASWKPTSAETQEIALRGPLGCGMGEGKERMGRACLKWSLVCPLTFLIAWLHRGLRLKVVSQQKFEGFAPLSSGFQFIAEKPHIGLIPVGVQGRLPWDTPL